MGEHRHEETRQYVGQGPTAGKLRIEPVGDCGCRMKRLSGQLTMRECPLHAAAPALLAALKACKEYIGTYYDNSRQSPAVEVYEQARAAIAEVEGNREA